MTASVLERGPVWRRAIAAGALLGAVLLAGSPAAAQTGTPAPASPLGFRAGDPPARNVILLPQQTPVAQADSSVALTGEEEAEPPPAPASATKEFPAPPVVDAATMTDDHLQPASCPSCGGGLIDNLRADPPHGGYNHSLCSRLFTDRCCNCGVGQCVPGREKPCYPCDCNDTACGRFLCGLYECICCPDPCYEPKWLPVADSAFFVEGARPITQTRLRWDHGIDVVLPDRSEYFMARADGMGRGPTPVAPAIAISRLRYDDLSLYTEASTGMIGVIVEMPYRSIESPDIPHGANFGDMNIATKTLIFDCELLQVSMIMRTFLPVGNPTRGLGTGHVSLEPSLVWGIKLHCDAYFQGQICEWIPLGGDPAYMGAVLHYHFSVNEVLARILPDVPLIGTLEMSGYHFQHGAFTDPIAGSFQQSSGGAYIYFGAGLRLFVCDRIDIGTSFEVPVTSEHFANPLFRSEFRFRY
jgi:hypothetical protein